MIIGDRLRDLRESKKMSQGDIEQRSGLLRCYISRVENGHTVPSVETLRKMAGALEMPLYQLFYDGIEQPKIPKAIYTPEAQPKWGNTGRDTRYFSKLRKLLAKLKENDRKLLLHFVGSVARQKNGSNRLRGRDKP